HRAVIGESVYVLRRHIADDLGGGFVFFDDNNHVSWLGKLLIGGSQINSCVLDAIGHCVSCTSHRHDADNRQEHSTFWSVAVAHPFPEMRLFLNITSAANCPP